MQQRLKRLTSPSRLPYYSQLEHVFTTTLIYRGVLRAYLCGV